MKNEKELIVKCLESNKWSSFKGATEGWDINEVGKQWIKKYVLALCKELLGTIRSKYASLPIPNAETTLDGDTLRTEAATEKEALVTQLREMLEQTSRKALLEADKDEAQHLLEKLAKVPYPIYIG